MPDPEITDVRENVKNNPLLQGVSLAASVAAVILILAIVLLWMHGHRNHAPDTRKGAVPVAEP